MTFSDLVSNGYIVFLNMKFTTIASNSHLSDTNNSHERRRKEVRPPYIRPDGRTKLVRQHAVFKAQYERRGPCEAYMYSYGFTCTHAIGAAI